MMYGHDMNAGGWLLSILVTLVIVGLIVFVVIALINSQRGAGTSQSAGEARSESARDVLDRRLASGEIGEEQYRRIRATLSERPTAASAASQPDSDG